MSATNRGSKRRESDFYETPHDVIHDFLENHFSGRYRVILEPCCGSGNMVRVLREHFPESTIIAQDILPVTPIRQANVTHGEIDFLAEPALGTPVDLIFTNPPYSIAEKIIRQALNTYPEATVVMLLRLDFLGSQDRYPFWSEHPANCIYHLACRPSFTGDGNTDSNNYGWFVWYPGRTDQRIIPVWGRATF